MKNEKIKKGMQPPKVVGIEKNNKIHNVKTEG